MPSDRLQRALDAGDVLALFPLFKDWPTGELLALLDDVDAFCMESYNAIDEAWKKKAFEAPVFFSESASRILDRLRDEKKQMVMLTMSEICSVVQFYLKERGINTEVPGEG